MKKFYFILLLTLFNVFAFAQNASFQLTSGDYVRLTGSRAAINNLSNFTIEFWAKFNNVTGNIALYDFDTSSQNGFYGGLILNNGKLAAGIASDNYSSVSNSLALTTNTWYHIAVVFHAGYWDFYVNGTAQGINVQDPGNVVVVPNASSFNVDDIIFGTNNNGAFTSFVGNIDDIRLWNTARTQAQIQANSNIELIGNESGLLGYWKLNETSGTTVNDSKSGGTPLNGVSSGITASQTPAFNSAVAPTVNTSAATSITASSAVLGGSVTADGGATVTGRGVVYSNTNTSPTIGGSNVTTAPNASGTGTYSATTAGLNPTTTYYVRAYATNSIGTSYGAVLSFTTSPAAPTIISNPVNRTVCIGSNATFSVSATGATSYQWQVSTGGSFSNLSNGGPYSNVTTTTMTITGTTAAMNGYQYRCVATNVSGSATSSAATLTVPTILGTTVVTNVACFGSNTGAINLTPSGGVSPYTYNWGGGITTEDRTGLLAGAYAVTITDANGCAAVVNATVSQPAAPVGGTTVVTNAACFGSATGAINLTPSGGVPPYTYDWGGGITTEDRTGLVAGSYMVTITDANGCAAVVNATVSQPAAPVGGTTVVTNVACFGSATGAINLTPSGGVSPYTYDWGGGITTEDRTGLVAGSYMVTITDANSCATVVNVTVSQPAAPVGGTTVVTNVACFGSNTGAINLTPNGGTSPYTYNWGGGITTKNRFGLLAGAYAVTITDANGCAAVVNATVSQPAAPVGGTTVVTNVACFGSATGAINLTPSGGVSPYTYDWGGGITTEDRTGLVAGSYMVTITDANSCATVVNVTVSQPAAPVGGTTVVTNVACFGSATGAINLTPSGGVSPYTYNWGGGITTEDRTGLLAGAYAVTVTDANGCVAVVNATVSQPAPVGGTTVVTNVACFGSATGAINLTPSGGVSPYTYDWGGGITTEDRTGLLAGAYAVTITDANGCAVVVNTTVSQPASPVGGTTVVTNVACFGSATGAINLTPSGGVSPYTYNWGGGITTEDRTGLLAGAYAVTITDANGCAVVVNATVSQPASPVGGTTVVTNVACFGSATGAINLTPSGGVSPYTYDWGGGITTEDRTGLLAGAYAVTITDANGCAAVVNVTVSQPPAPVGGTTVVTNVACFGSATGAINLTPSGGVSPYTYNWGGGITTEDRTGLLAGAYAVTITDANGCAAVVNATVSQPAAPVGGTTVVTNVACFGSATGAINLTPSGGVSPYTYNWGGGITTEDRTGLLAGAYAVTITDANGCAAVVNATVGQPNLLTVTLTKTNLSASGANDGVATAVANGGTAPYTYSWSFSNAATASISGLPEGTYSVTVTDANSCSVNQSILVDGPPSAPNNLSVTSGNGSNSLNWTANIESDVVSYKIYAGTAINPTTVIATVAATTTTYNHVGLNNGTDYHYRLKAVDVAGNESAFGNEKIGTPRDTPIITLASAATVTYGQLDYTLAATSTNQATPLVYSSSNPSVATISATGTVRIVGVGSVSLSAYQPGNQTYNAASTVTQNLVVLARTVTVTAIAQLKIFGNSDPLLTYNFTPSLVGNDTFTGNLVRVSGNNVGTYTINQGTLALNNNYVLNVVPSTLTINAKPITATANSQVKIYGDADPTFTFSYTPALVGSDTFTGNLSRSAGNGVGSYSITQGTLSLNTNYALAVVASTLTINPKTVTVNVLAQQKIYGEVDPTLTYSYTPNLAYSDTFTGNVSRVAGEQVGTYRINQGTLTLNPNYALTVVAASLTINAKAVTVTAISQSKIYGTPDPVLTYTYAPALAFSDTFTGNLSRAVGTNIGSYTISQGTLSLGTNYLLTVVPATLTINTKAVTVTISAQNKVYGNADPILSYSYTPNLVGSDTFTGNLSRVAGENVGNYAINAGTLSLGVNYTTTIIPSVLTIAAKSVTVTAMAISKTYGDNDPPLSYSVNPALITGDSFSGALNRVVGNNVGSYAILQGSLTLNQNYVLNYIGANLLINPKALTITADNKSKIQGASNPTLTVSYAGFIAGENNVNALSTQPILTTTANVASSMGNYPIVVSGAAARNNNYTITYVNGILTVTAGLPTAIDLVTTTIFENRPSGTLAGVLSSSSADPNAVFSYALVGGVGSADNARFTIIGNRLLTADTYDFETQSNFSVRIRTTTQYGLSLERSFTIAVADVNEAPTIDAIVDQTICYSSTIQNVNLTGITAGPEVNQTLSMTVSTNNPALFKTISITPATGVNATLSYSLNSGVQGTALVTVLITDNGGVLNGGSDSNSRTFNIIVNPLPIVTIRTSSGVSSISKGETIRLQSEAQGAVSYRWSNALGIISGQNTAVLTVRPSQTTTYTVMALNANGCSEIKTLTIEVREDFAAVKPRNILTPNGDGANDTWIIDNIDQYPNAEVKVFDRSGRVVYLKRGYDNTWDGSIGGEPLKESAYLYVIDFGSGLYKAKGTLTIIRNR